MGEHVQRILLPEEKVLFEARVHPVIYASGTALCLLALILAKYTQVALAYVPSAPPSPVLPSWLPIPFITDINLWIIEYYHKLLSLIPSGGTVAFILAGITLFGGAYLLAKAYTIAEYTELTVTDRRIIAKYGFAAVTMIELDRFKIAEVIVFQSFNGRMFGYGMLHIRSFTGLISGLPPIAHPYDFQKALNRREI